MNNIVDKTVKRMQELMNSSNTISESKKNATDPVEYASKGPDGNYYGSNPEYVDQRSHVHTYSQTFQ